MQIPTPLQSPSLLEQQHPSGSGAGHLLSTLKTYKYAENRAPVLEVMDIQKRFDQFQALNHINLDVQAGEFVSFLGPSGCGKTTLLRIIAGLEQPDYGKVIKKGVDITRQQAEKRRCGIVFQNYALFPNLTVKENIAFGLSKNQWSSAERDERVHLLLDLIELPDIAGKYPNQLSGGQQQRVALARAIAPKPDVLLLDEPLSALDAQVRLNVRQKIRSIQQQFDLPTIMVTHDQEEALSISDRVVVMNHGVIEQIDSPHNIYYKPQTSFVARFIGSMNFLDAVCQQPHQLDILGSMSLNFPQQNLQVGQHYTLGFRPESVMIVEEAAADEQFLYMPVQVKSSEFLGAKRRLFCEIELENMPSADVPTLQIEIENAQSAQIQTQMLIRVAHPLIHIFDEQGRALC
ncbi:ABC transporter ATP-binding protein [Acinetobacter sp. WZC-1]|uniref:ABC transporter ATP-binding protein n=1 Tax=Acinetobacter sp. WZC-1 TaxID=3459034 RepID=UPI00403E03DF